MTLKDIAAVSGKPGLFKVIKPARSGMIVESLNAEKKKMMVNASQRISILQEISMYVTGPDESVNLREVLLNVHAAFPAGKLSVNTKEPLELAEFMTKVLPNYDTDRVYTSDIKKLVQWYNLLVEEVPEIFANMKAETEVEAAPKEGESEKAGEGESEEKKAAE